MQKSLKEVDKIMQFICYLPWLSNSLFYALLLPSYPCKTCRVSVAITRKIDQQGSTSIIHQKCRKNLPRYDYKVLQTISELPPRQYYNFFHIFCRCDIRVIGGQSRPWKVNKSFVMVQSKQPLPPSHTKCPIFHLYTVLLQTCGPSCWV